MITLTEQTNAALTDRERITLVNKSYDSNLYPGSPITADGTPDGKLIGYVAQVINNPASGEQSYIITDRKINSEADKAKVTNVTVLYRGSTPIDEPGADMAEDWLLNDLPEAAQILRIRSESR